MLSHHTTENATRYPLNSIVGTRSAVSILRELVRAQVPLSQSELARRAHVHLRGLPAALAALESAGIVSYAGRGRTRQVQLHHRHPLNQPLLQLFQAESNRWNSIVEGLRQVPGPPPNGLVAAWIEGPVAEGKDTFGMPVDATFLYNQGADIGLQANVQQRINLLQAQQHVVIAARFHQRADLLRFTPERWKRLESAIPLYGPAPVDLAPAASRDKASARRGKKSSQAMTTDYPIAEMVAARLTRDPELAVRAREYVQRRLTVAADTERLTLLEWQGLLDSLTPGQLAQLLREDSERADRLRQSLSFVGVLADPKSR